MTKKFKSIKTPLGFIHGRNGIFLATVASCVLYVLSLFVPCYYSPVYLSSDHVATPKPEYGIAALLLGWIEVITEGYSAWLANPLWLLSLLLILGHADRWISVVISTVGFLFSLSFLFYNSVLVNEAGHKGEIIGYGIGYWLWLSSFVLLLGIASFQVRPNMDEPGELTDEREPESTTPMIQ